MSVLPEPVVSLPEVIQDLAGAVVIIGVQHNAGAGVGVAVDSEHHEQQQHRHHHDRADEDPQPLSIATLSDLSIAVIQSPIVLISLWVIIFRYLIVLEINGEQLGEGDGWI